MLGLSLATILVAQLASDGLHVTRDVPADLNTWRWVEHDGRAVLAWGHVGENGRVKRVHPHPPFPIYPDPAAAVPVGATIPSYATDGVVVEKLARDGVTLRASDPETAKKARQTLYEATAKADCPTDSEEKIRLPTPSFQVGPDWSVIALYGVAAGLFVFAGYFFYRSSRPPAR